MKKRKAESRQLYELSLDGGRTRGVQRSYAHAAGHDVEVEILMMEVKLCGMYPYILSYHLPTCHRLLCGSVELSMITFNISDPTFPASSNRDSKNAAVS
jgi:hypothetical protein